MANPAFVLPDQIFTPEAYLLLENDNKSGSRHEYVKGSSTRNGRGGASRNHNLVSGRLYACLLQHLQGTPCEPFQIGYEGENLTR